MEYRRLGRCGLKVSEICLGTMTFGHGTDAAEAARMVLMALDAGVTFFDTADGYSFGESETMLGHALGARRREAVTRACPARTSRTLSRTVGAA
jgi:aryl-alcohol dehydrogenase-like predicted oxidoreductase